MLGVHVLRGELHWGWSQGINRQQLIPIFGGWPLDGVVWDGAHSHRGKLMGQLGFARIFLPAYSPELNRRSGCLRKCAGTLKEKYTLALRLKG